MSTPTQSLPPAFLAQAAQPQPAAPVPAPEPVNVVDLDAEVKRQREALPKPTTFRLLGVAITLPPIQALTLDAQLKFAGDEVGALVSILGADQIERLRGAGAQLSDLLVLVSAWQQASGVDAGESAASTGS